MAHTIALRNPETDLTATSYSGFSWTTLFFGAIPALFRGDFITFLIIAAIDFILAGATFMIGAIFFNIVWAFFYNSFHARSLISKGYMTEGAIAQKEAAKTEAATQHHAEEDRRQADLADAIARGDAQAIAAQRNGPPTPATP